VYVLLEGPVALSGDKDDAKTGLRGKGKKPNNLGSDSNMGLNISDEKVGFSYVYLHVCVYRYMYIFKYMSDSNMRIIYLDGKMVVYIHKRIHV
jgi:hypothetical protein